VITAETTTTTMKNLLPPCYYPAVLQIMDTPRGNGGIQKSLSVDAMFILVIRWTIEGVMLSFVVVGRSKMSS
jgi:hypothetical protein